MPRPGDFRLLAAVAAIAALPPCWPQPSRAENLVFKVAPLISRTSSGPCPESLSLIETFQPYREGSYGVDGRAAFEAIATGWRLADRDAFSATWMGNLRPALRRCMASAGITRRDKAPHQGPSHLRLRFSDGQVRLILDMTGLRDPNGYTPGIQSAGLKQGQPVWSWSGSD